MGWPSEGTSQPARPPQQPPPPAAAAAAINGLEKLSLRGSRLGGALQQRAGAKRAAFSQRLR
jgi:hypothetical protein